MDPNLVNLKYNDLRKAAKDLGISNFGEYSGLPTKEQILDRIKEFHENGGVTEIKKKKIKKQKEEPKQDEVDRPTRRTTRRTTHMEAELVAELDQNQPEEPAQPEPEVKKKKRVVKKSNKENTEPIVAAVEKDAKKTTKKIKTKAEEEKPTIESNKDEKVGLKQTKAKKKQSEQAKESVTALVTEPLPEPAAPILIEHPKEEKEVMKVKNTKAKKVKKTTKAVEETIVAETNDMIYDTNTNQSDEFQLKLDEEDETEQQKLECENNLSIMTNDDEPMTAAKPDNQELNVTVDILNRTFDKEPEFDNNRTQARLVSAVIAPLYIENNDNPTIATQSTNEQSVSCNSFYKHHQQPAEEVIPKQRARIVRPKQVAIVSEVVVDKEESVINKRVVVDIIQREAGPRIVKPTESEVNRKNTDKSSNDKKPKELKSSKVSKGPKAPDFKTIHEKNFEKLESVSDNQQRLNERHKQLTHLAPKTPTQQMSKLTLGSTKKLTTSITTSELNKATDSVSTPKMLKTKSSVSVTNSTQKNTNIPRLLISKKTIAEPKTPNANENRVQSVIKTPQSQLKPKHSLLQSAKKPSFSFKYENQNVETINFSSGCQFNAGNTKNLLATSSFNRRKSFDLNASLARPLNYKRHTGKLKPVDPIGASKNGLLKPANMNESMAVQKPSILSRATVDNKRKSLLKQRELFKQIKPSSDDHENDENIPMIKASEQKERLKVKRKKKFDETRDLNEQVNNVHQD